MGCNHYVQKFVYIYDAENFKTCSMVSAFITLAQYNSANELLILIAFSYIKAY